MLTAALVLSLLNTASACQPPELSVYDSQPREGETASTLAVVRVFFSGENGDLSEPSVTADGESVSGAWELAVRQDGYGDFDSVMTFTPEAPFADGAQVSVVAQVDDDEWSMAFTAIEGEPARISEPPTIERLRVRHDNNSWSSGMCSSGEMRLAVLELTAAADDSRGALALYKVDPDGSGEPSGEPFLISPGVQQGTQELTFWYSSVHFAERPQDDCMVLVQLDEAGGAAEPTEMQCPRRVRVMCAAASAGGSWALLVLSLGAAFWRRRGS